MLKAELIGHLGADAEIKDVDGVRFVACRIADSNTWTDRNGVKHEQTRWVDVTLPQDSPVFPYLKRGTQVFVRGNMDTRVYSSEKDRCMKCGITIRAIEVQLLSASKKDEQVEAGKEEKQDAPF